MYDMDIDPDDFPQIDGPSALLPNLAEWGIDAVDLGVCEDSFDNRRIIRENQARWMPVFSATGEPTNLIQVVTAEMRQASLLNSKAVILKDKQDPDSDYITGVMLIITPAADNVVPAWVLAATRHWEEVVDERQRRNDIDTKKYRPALAGPPARCLATTLSGKRCANWSNGRVETNGLCRVHIANHIHDTDTPGVNTLAKARNRILSASIGAVDALEEVLLDPESGAHARVAAANSILDRGGLRAGVDMHTDVTITVKPAAEIVADRLADLKKNLQSRNDMLAEIASAEEAAQAEAEPVTVEIVDEDE